MKLTLDHLKVFVFIKDSSTRWFDINQVAHHTGVNTSVVARCLSNWMREGILVRNDMFRAHLYHLAEGHEKTPLWDLLIATVPIFHELDPTKDSQAS